MAVVSQALNLVYFDITKVGSSTLKETLWELDHGTPFKGRGIVRIGNNLRWRLARAKLAAPRNIHEQDGYRTQKFGLTEVPDGYASFTLTRDPAARIKSAWRDKIHGNQFRWRGEEMDIENEGLPMNPDFGEFIDHFYDYRAVSRPVRVHTTPYSWHLGEDIVFFDRVFKIEEIGEMTKFLSERLRRPFPMRHENRSVVNLREDRLTARQIDRLLQITEPDYVLLGDMYDIGAAQEMLAA
ncbi:sulfotransferase family 2 domain-containing protein [Sulfitobacter sp. MF3-043]|uniref:sulfotransferase family 2 domain-containing protein n=1 Tax=Sulfitobacter sediminivivens TaxID=3252902 RepID=UPI0036DB16D4